MTTYEASRAAFDAYAGLDAPALPSDRWSAAQVRHCRWTADQFGYAEQWKMVLGIVEEAGELAEAWLADDLDGIRDACADALIFATGLATLCRLDLGTIARLTIFDPSTMARDSMHEMSLVVGRLSHLTLKNAQHIRGIGEDTFRRRVCDELGRLWCVLKRASRRRGMAGGGFDLEAAYFETLDEVLKRDWRASPATGVA